MTAIPTRVRQLVNGVWQYTTFDEGGGGGGSHPFIPERNIGQCSLDFNAFVPAGGNAPAPFSLLSGDSTMVDLTTPTAPEPVEAGTYAYTLTATASLAPPGAALAVLRVDDDWYSLVVERAIGTDGKIAEAATWYSDAGSPFSATFIEASGIAFSGILYVQRVT